MAKAWKTAVVLSLLANAVSIGLLVNHYSWIGDVEVASDSAVARAAEAREASEDAERDLENAVGELGELQSILNQVEPFDPSELQQQIEELDRRITNISFGSASIDPGSIDTPFFCRTGDVVYWDRFGGLTC